MSRLTCSISVSLDGYVAWPDQGLGAGGEELHEWIFGLASWREMHGREGSEHNVDSNLLQEGLDATGAIIIGKRMLGGWDGPWGDEPTLGVWGENPPFDVPVFVLTHYEREPLTMLQLSVVPLLLGGGVRLLDNLGEPPPKLKQTRVVESPSGVAHLRYEVVKH